MAWLSFACALAGSILICLGDPLWLGLPCSVTGLLAGLYVLRKTPDDSHVAAHLGVNLGMFNLFTWLLLIVFMQYILNIDPRSLFSLPT